VILAGIAVDEPAAGGAVIVVGESSTLNTFMSFRLVGMISFSVVAAHKNEWISKYHFRIEIVFPSWNRERRVL